MLGSVTPWPGNPILRPTGNGWQSANVYNPAAVVHEDRVVLLYRAHAADKISRLGYAVSDDGRHFEAEPWPVLEPTEPYELRGCEDPRITFVEGAYHLTYTGFDGTSALLCLATSTDLRNWTRHGPLFPDLDTWQTLDWARQRRDRRPWNKAGGIVPLQLGGLWHMYLGEGAVYHATSPDLRTWTADPTPLLEGRPGSWDRDLVEVGAPPVVVEDSLVLLVNGAKITSLDPVVVDYRCGQVTFSTENPRQVSTRDNEPLLQPTTREEKAGLVPHVTFVEGLVRFRNRWLVYYGQSDTTAAVAIGQAVTDRSAAGAKPASGD